MSRRCAKPRWHESPTTNGGISVPHVLAELTRALPGPLTASHCSDLDAICRKIAVTGTLLAHYDDGWKTPTTKQPLPAEQWQAAIATLAAWSDVLAAYEAQRGLSLKLLNTVLTALDARPGNDNLRTWGRDRLNTIAIPEGDIIVSPVCRSPVNPPRTLPLTVLAYEGPCVRAYLSMLRRAGLRPQRILLVVLSEHPSSGKPVGRWFPGRLRTWYAEKTQDMALNYWPRRIRSAYPQLASAITASLEPLIDRPAETIAEMYGPARYETYADTVDRVVARDLRDDAVYKSLCAVSPGTILFTGGGILPSRLIDIPGLRFLHVHPGCLPHVRGADGMLWSMLVRGQPAMSCFYQASGLDTGDVIAVRDYTLPSINLRQAFDDSMASNTARPDDQTLYRALFGFIDPLLRAHLLADVLSDCDDPARLASTRQNHNDGITYHFMHADLRRRTLAAIF